MSYTLTYFKVRGLAEFIRLVAAEAQITLKEKFVDKESFAALKPSLPFGQVPVLEKDDDSSFVISQSKAIARYLANKHNLAPTNLEDAARADQYVDAVADYKQAFSAAYWSPEKDAKVKEFKETKAPFFLGKFENFLLSNGGQFFVGKNITYADLAVYDVLEGAAFYLGETLDAYPTLKSFKEAISNRPNLKDYINSPDRTKFIVNTN